MRDKAKDAVLKAAEDAVEDGEVSEQDATSIVLEADEKKAEPSAAQLAVRDCEPEPGASKPDPILTIDGITRSFGGLLASNVEHLEVQRGVITAFIGPNGAGKTTLFNLISRFDQCDTGRWQLNGEEMSKKQPHQVARAGMVRTFQLTKSLGKMTVMENMMLGAQHQIGESLWASLLTGMWKKQENEFTARAEELLQRFKLTHMRDKYAATLSGGQRKLLEMARALMCEPQLILLDEPMAGVNPALVQSLLHHVEGLREDGVSVLFIEHDMDVIMGISDWIVVLAEGSVIAEGTPEQIAQNDIVIDAYLGTSYSDTAAEEEVNA